MVSNFGGPLAGYREIPLPTIGNLTNNFNLLEHTMEKRLRIFPFLILLSLIIFSSFSHSAIIDQEITKSYTASDYEKTVRLLERQIEEQKLRDSKAEGVEYFGLYTKYLLLCHLYAWRLNKPEVALLKYQELNGLRRSYKSASKFPPLELLYIAEIYEVRNDYPKARENTKIF